MKRYFAQHGPGDIGIVIGWADGVILRRERMWRGRDYCSRIGTFAFPRTCDRLPGEPGIFPLEARVKLPEQCDS